MRKEEKSAKFERLKIAAELVSSSKKLNKKLLEYEKIKTELHKCTEDSLIAIKNMEEISKSTDSEKYKETQNVLKDFLKII